MNFAWNARLPHSTQGSFICRKSTTWDRRLYFPSEGRRAEDFFALKGPTASAGFEPANLGTKGQHATSRPQKPYDTWVCTYQCFECTCCLQPQNLWIGQSIFLQTTSIYLSHYETYNDSLCNLEVPCHNNLKPHKQLSGHGKVSFTFLVNICSCLLCLSQVGKCQVTFHFVITIMTRSESGIFPYIWHIILLLV